MATVPSGIVIAWPSTAASIPSGWSRKTAWDGRYIRGAVAAGDAGGTGGNASHTHTTASTHNHTAGGSHYHTIIAPTGSGVGNGNNIGTPTVASLQGHGHSGFASTATSAGITNGALTLVAYNNDMAYTEVIWIESNGTPTGMPKNCYCFYDSDSLPWGWDRVKGNRYLKGAATSSDPAADGGSNTHVHTSSHTHSGDKHAHSSTTSSASTEPLNIDNYATGFGLFAQIGHTHNVGINTGQDSVSCTVSMTSESTEPSYKKLNCIENNTGSDSFPDGIIALWSSTHASIPTNWTRVTAQDDLFTKHSNADSEVGNTGGGATGHNHGSVTCHATSDGHDHLDLTSTTGPSSTQVGNAPGSFWAAGNHGHNGTWNVLLSYPTYSDATGITVSTSASEDHYPLWIRGIYVKFSAVSSRTPTRTMTGVGV